MLSTMSHVFLRCSGWFTDFGMERKSSCKSRSSNVLASIFESAAQTCFRSSRNACWKPYVLQVFSQMMIWTVGMRRRPALCTPAFFLVAIMSSQSWMNQQIRYGKTGEACKFIKDQLGPLGARKLDILNNFDSRSIETTPEYESHFILVSQYIHPSS